MLWEPFVRVIFQTHKHSFSKGGRKYLGTFASEKGTDEMIELMKSQLWIFFRVVLVSDKGLKKLACTTRSFWVKQIHYYTRVSVIRWAPNFMNGLVRRKQSTDLFLIVIFAAVLLQRSLDLINKGLGWNIYTQTCCKDAGERSSYDFIFKYSSWLV